MSEPMKNALNVVQGTKSAATVSGTTMIVGLAEWFNGFPWGKIAACIGAFLSLVMVFIRISNYYLDKKEKKLRRELLHLEIEKHRRDIGTCQP